MSIEIIADDDELVSRWDEYVSRSPQGTVFHSLDFLRVIARHSDTSFHLLGGFKGQEPVGVFPIFHRSIGPFEIVFSPPPNVGMFQLGPALLNTDSLKQRRREKRTRRFLDGCIDWIATELDPFYFHLRMHHAFDALRPFQWRGFELTPLFTYVVDLDVDEEDHLMRFSSDARANIREMREHDCIVEERGADGIHQVMSHLHDRYDEQRRSFPLSAEYVIDLYETLPTGTVRSYVCTVDGEFATGMITLEGETTIYRWQGGVRPTVEFPANDYLDWRIMRMARDRGKQRYDLVGANTERLTEYKAKFNPTVVDYSMAVGGACWAQLAADLYQRVPHLQAIVDKNS